MKKIDFMCQFTDLFRSSSYSKWRINHPLSGHRFMDVEAKYLISENQFNFALFLCHPPPPLISTWFCICYTSVNHLGVCLVMGYFDVLRTWFCMCYTSVSISVYVWLWVNFHVLRLFWPILSPTFFQINMRLVRLYYKCLYIPCYLTDLSVVTL